MVRRTLFREMIIAGALLVASAATSVAQIAGAKLFGRVSFNMNTADWQAEGAPSRRDTEFSTAVTFEAPDLDDGGFEYGLDMRHSRYSSGDRPERVSLYSAFAGARIGEQGQFRMRAGHLWLQDLGTVGALAGGLVEFRQPRAVREATRVRIGVFAGLEPRLFDTGYAPHVRKYGAYVAVDGGPLRRHTIGYALVRNGSIVERSVLTTTNFFSAGRKLFVYQAAEVDTTGPAGGTGTAGLSYFFANVRVAPTSRLEVLGTYNRGRSVDARRLAEDVVNGRPLTTRMVEGLQYESRGARVTVELARNVRVYAGYAHDRDNQGDTPTERVLFGGHAGNLLGTGLDVSASDSRIERATGPYHSRYFSVGRAIGRPLYVSLDYSTSLSVVRFQRSDGLIIETRPWSRRVSGHGSAILTRRLSLVFSVDYTRDDAMSELRLLSGLSYRLR